MGRGKGRGGVRRRSASRRRSRKTGKRRSAKSVRELAAELRALRPRNAATSQPVFSQMVPEIETFQWDLTQAGIPFMDDLGWRADLHALRKTFGTALVLNGEHPRVVMEAMRHSDLKLTMQLYTDAGQLPVKAALTLLPWNSGDKSKDK